MRARRRMARVGLGALVGLVGLTSGCGVRADTAPRSLDAASAPAELLDETAPDEAAEGVEAAAIYLLDLEDRLVRVERRVDAVRVNLVLLALTRLLSDEEAEDELGSEIPPDTRLEVEGPDADGIVTVNVNVPGDDGTFAGERQRLAVAQIVYTATAVRGVKRVRFEFDGQPSDIPDDRGETIPGPVGRDDFDELAPRGGS